MTQIDPARMTREDMLSEMVSDDLQNLAKLAMSDWGEFEAQLGPVLRSYMMQEYEVLTERQLAGVYLAIMGKAPVGWGGSDG